MLREPGPDATRPDWTARARVLAWATVAWNLLEGLAAMGFGWQDDSLSLFGFGADSFVEVGAALLVLWRLSAEGRHGGCAATRLARERRAAMGIGGLLLLLALGTALGAVVRLGQGRGPETGWPGVAVALLSLAFMAWLWRAKVRAARALDSRALAGDAACSLACIQLSVILLAGSLLTALAPALAWADPAAALVLAALIAREGLGSVRAARRPDFTGGCGCA